VKVERTFLGFPFFLFLSPFPFFLIRKRLRPLRGRFHILLLFVGAQQLADVVLISDEGLKRLIF
jgi:hypothetical protein